MEGRGGAGAAVLGGGVGGAEGEGVEFVVVAAGGGDLEGALTHCCCEERGGVWDFEGEIVSGG